MSRMDEALALIERARQEEQMPFPQRESPEATLRDWDQRREHVHNLRLEASVLAIAALIETLDSVNKGTNGTRKD